MIIYNKLQKLFRSRALWASVTLCFLTSCNTADDTEYLSYKQQKEKTDFGKVITNLVVNEFQSESDISIQAIITPKRKMILVNECSVQVIDFSVYSPENEKIISAIDGHSNLRIGRANDFNDDLSFFVTLRSTIKIPENYTTKLEFHFTEECDISPAKYTITERFKMHRSKMNWLEKLFYSQ